MNDREKFLLDLRGYLVVRDMLSPEQVAALNAAVDAHEHEVEWEDNHSYGGGMRGLDPDGQHMGGTRGSCLEWEQPHCQPFRDLIANPKTAPYLDTLFGESSWRLDHGVGVMMARKGASGHGLHGSTSRVFDSQYYYHHSNGQIRTGMLRCQYQLRDIGPGMGGLAVIPGSHKANFFVPEDIALHSADQDCVVAVEAKAGDMVIFLEATIHGSLPWVADYTRRSLMFSYVPMHMALAPQGYSVVMEPWISELTAAQQAVLGAPSTNDVVRDALMEGRRPRHIGEEGEGAPMAVAARL